MEAIYWLKGVEKMLLIT
jgi:hypothetical protein